MSDKPISERLYDLSISLFFGGFDSDPDDITRILDLQPTSITRKGQSFPPPRHPQFRAKRNLWQFKPPQNLPEPPPYFLEIAPLLRPFREALEPRLEKIAMLPPCDAIICIYVIPWSITPAFGFDPNSMSFLGRLGIPLEIDIQNFGSDDEDDK
jgi:hypothetical protein